MYSKHINAFWDHTACLCNSWVSNKVFSESYVKLNATSNNMYRHYISVSTQQIIHNILVALLLIKFATNNFTHSNHSSVTKLVVKFWSIWTM